MADRRLFADGQNTPDQIAQMYDGIYGGLPSALAAAPPQRAGGMSDIERQPAYEALAAMFGASAAPNGLGYQMGYVKDDNERLYSPALNYVNTPVGQGVPRGQVQPQQPVVGGGPTTRYAQSLPFGPIQNGAPIQVVANAQPIRSAAAAIGKPRVISAPVQRPSIAAMFGSPAPAPVQQTAVQQLQNQGLSPAAAYAAANEAARQQAASGGKYGDGAGSGGSGSYFDNVKNGRSASGPSEGSGGVEPRSWKH